jgi:hypothetical protein
MVPATAAVVVSQGYECMSGLMYGLWKCLACTYVTICMPCCASEDAVGPVTAWLLHTLAVDVLLALTTRMHFVVLPAPSRQCILCCQAPGNCAHVRLHLLAHLRCLLQFALPVFLPVPRADGSYSHLATMLSIRLMCSCICLRFSAVCCSLCLPCSCPCRKLTAAAATCGVVIT